MVDVERLGWRADTVGELDHHLLKAPHVKLRSAIEGSGGTVFSVDLRITRPNSEFLSSTEMHTFEHFMLAGFRKYLPSNFISIGLMGCRTGFYLILFNEGRVDEICRVYEQSLQDVLIADEVPYANPTQCGNFKDHSLDAGRSLARRVLAAKQSWREVI